jgi:hypothetical protein
MPSCGSSCATCARLVDTKTVDGVTVRVYAPEASGHAATGYDTGTPT